MLFATHPLYKTSGSFSLGLWKCGHGYRPCTVRALGRNDFQGTEIQIKAACPNALINNLEPDNLVNARQDRKERQRKW